MTTDSTSSTPASETTTSVTATPAEVKKTTVVELHTDVASVVAERSKELKSALVASLAEKELEVRGKALLAVYDEIVKTKAEIKKVKPDHETFNLDGTTATVAYSKAKVEEVKKLNEKLAKLEKAFSLAVDQNDFSKVKEEAKKG